jgi:tetratricopeptide (TPR) repeat protein
VASADPNITTFVSVAFYDQARCLLALGDERRALVRYKAFADRARSSTDPEVRWKFARAAMRRAALLARRGALEDALSVLDEAAGDPGVVETLGPNDWAKLMLDRTQALLAVERPAEAILAAAAVVERLAAADDDPETRKLISRALLAKIAILGNVGRIPESEADMELLIEDFAEDALAALDDDIEQYSGTTDRFNRKTLAITLSSKAGILKGLERDPEAKAVFRQLINEFQNVKDPKLVVLVAHAREQL